jgi:putative transposase
LTFSRAACQQGEMAMRKSKFTEAQVAAALKECAAGTPVGQVARKLGVSEQTLYVWKRRYGSLDTSEIRKVRQLEEENGKLKRLVADLSLDKVMLQDLLSRKW